MSQSNQDFDNFLESVKKFTAMYSAVPGVISIEPDQFGSDIITVIFDDKRFNRIDLPKTFGNYDVCCVGLYALCDTFEGLVTVYTIHIPNSWDAEYDIPFQKSLNNIQNDISSYEEKLDVEMKHISIKPRNTLNWILSVKGEK